MEHDDLFALMRTWGYYLFPKTHAQSPGYPGVVVAMRSHPTEAHFDPESMELCLNTLQSATEHVHLTQRVWRHMPHRVCAGRITLRDRVSKRVDFYTYGATLDFALGPDITLYSLSSSAPILSLASDDEDSFPEQLVAETERLLARHHARWGRNDAAFVQCLNNIEPMALYFATLRSIRLNYNRHPELRTNFSYLFTMIQQEIQWQAESGHWADNGPLLMDLLAAPQIM
jgi:hypothetical protein